MVQALPHAVGRQHLQSGRHSVLCICQVSARRSSRLTGLRQLRAG